MMCHASFSRGGRGTWDGRPDPLPHDDFATAIGEMTISWFQPFYFNVKCPLCYFILHLYVDKGVVFMIYSCFLFISWGTRLTVLRMACLLELAQKCLPSMLQVGSWMQGDYDSLLAAHHEVDDLIITCHGMHEVRSSSLYIINLSFAYDHEISKQIIWNEGNHLLYAIFCVIRSDAPHPLHHGQV